MRLLFKQRMSTRSDSYDIYDDAGRTTYTMEERLSWGHRLVIYNAMWEEVGEIWEKISALLSRFCMYTSGNCTGFIEREFTFFKPKYHLSRSDWKIEENFIAWDHGVISGQDGCIVHTSKEILHLIDTYVLDIRQGEHALLPLMVVLAVDATKCPRNEQECAICILIHEQKSSLQVWQRDVDEGSFEGIIETGERVLQEENRH